ncbi:hypothetical protein C7Z54_13960 [Listeria monocytogenes]|nr:hypothetical protein [Listeria monocytogenes]EAG5364304.1 hypothetical protein [Listeria monocytogenes]EJG4800227.1 hypothetical protein [Listeria monocytogenes]
MIHLKGITTTGAYDKQGKYLEEIHEDIEKIMKRLILQFDIYQFHISHNFEAATDKSVLVRQTRFKKTYIHFYKEDEERFEEGSSYDQYFLVEKDCDISEQIDKLELSEIPKIENIRAELLSVFPLLVILSDSSELMAYSMEKSNLELI